MSRLILTLDNGEEVSIKPVSSALLRFPEPEPQEKFQLVFPAGEIEEFECRMSDIEFPADGGLILPPIRTLNIRHGSIYDPEGSD